MPQTNVNIRMDQETKDQADQLFKALGMNMSIAVNVFVKQAIRLGGIPFDISLTPNARTRQAMEETEAGQGLSEPFDSVEDLMRDLNA